MKVSDYLRSYPSAYSRNYQEDISSKKEFNSLRSLPTEEVPGPGEYYKHQKLTHRVLTESDNMFILSETGTGKSGEVLGFCDQVVTEILKERRNPGSSDERLSHFRRIYVICGKVPENELKHQLVCKINPARYYGRDDAEKVESNVNLSPKEQRRQQKSLVTRILGEWFTFDTYEAFANKIAQKDDETLKRDFTHSIFWIDEAHNLLISYKEGEDGDIEAHQRNRDETLKQYERLSSLPFCKRILTTATPMMNDTKEFISFFNLLLPGTIPNLPLQTFFDMTDLEWSTWFPTLPRRNDYSFATLGRAFRGKIPLDTDIDFMPEENLEVYLRGRVSYIRALDTGADLEYVGYNPETFQTPREDDGSLYTADFGQMSDFQRDAYLEVLESGGSMNIAKLQTATFVYPNGTYKDTKGYIIRQEKKEEITISNELIEAFKSNGVRHYSWKFADICEAIMNGVGKCFFIYCPFIDAAGIHALSACLTFYGASRFAVEGSVFEGEGGSVGGYCSSTEKKKKRVSPSFLAQSGGRPHYALLTGDTPTSLRHSIMEVMHSEDNAHGEIIRAIIVSRVGRDGLSFNNVTEVFFPYSEYNYSAIYQAMSRVMRATSFVTLRRENPDKRIEVKVHLMCSVYQMPNMDSWYTTYEKNAYDIAFGKKRKIFRVMRFFEKAAIGCNINYSRNVRNTDRDGSDNCRYEECAYKCYQQPRPEEDQSTYNIYFLQEDIDRCVLHLRNLFSQFMFLSRDQIAFYSPDYSNVVIDRALADIISSKKRFTNLYGIGSFLYEDYAGFHVSTEYSFETANPSSNWYSNNLFCTDNVPLDDFRHEIEQKKIPQLLREMSQKSVIDIKNQLRKNTTKATRTDIYEACYPKRDIQGTLENMICNFYANYLFVVPVNLDEIKKMQNTPRKGEITHSRITDKKRLLQISRDTASQLASGYPHYIVHTLDSISDSDTAAGTLSEYVRADCIPRIYEESTKTWRNANEFEKYFIVITIQGLIFEKLNYFNRDPPTTLVPRVIDYKGDPMVARTYYGTIVKGIFRVACMDNTNEKMTKSQDGKECADMSNFEKFDLLFSYGAGVDQPKVRAAFQATPEEVAANIPVYLERLLRDEKKKVNSFSPEMGLPFLVYSDMYLNSGVDNTCPFIFNTLLQNQRIIEIS